MRTSRAAVIATACVLVAALLTAAPAAADAVRWSHLDGRDSGKLASGLSSSVAGSNLKRTGDLTPESWWGNDSSWNVYAYGIGNPIKFVDPLGRDVMVALTFSGENWKAETKQAVIGKVANWWKGQDVGNVYVYDTAKAKDPNWFKGGRASIEVNSDIGGTHKPTFVGASKYLNSTKLTADQMTNAIANAINHEVFSHQFKLFDMERYDSMFFNRDLDWVTSSDDLRERVGTVVDAHIKNDPTTVGKFFDGPVPVHPADTVRAQEELRDIQLKPPVAR